jgi:hypothetical protein
LTGPILTPPKAGRLTCRATISRLHPFLELD